MLAWARRVARFAQGLVDVGAWLVAVVLLVVVFLCWHTVHAPDLTVMRAALARLHSVVAGQQIEALSLEARVEPDRRELVAVATLRLRSLEHERAAWYFLLDPGFHVLRIQNVSSTAEPTPVPWVQLGPVVQILSSGVGTSVQAIRVEYEGSPRLHPEDCRITAAEVLLGPDCLWYPLDAQSFFSLEARVELPSSWELVDTTTATEVNWRGTHREHRWESGEPIAGFGLVAGAYRYQERWAGATRLRAYVPQGDELDPVALLDTIETGYQTLVDRLGACRLPVVSLFVHPTLQRAFHDGAGGIGIPRRALASEDAGFGLVTHELAHCWWGATVTGGWLRTGNAAQWIIEGFAELSSLLASETVYGPDAAVKRLLGEFYDPVEQKALTEMTVLDNALPQARGRETIYRKGAYVLWMLRHIVGDSAFLNALREILQTYPTKEIGASEVQEVFERVSGRSLGDFFEAFVRGRATLDFAVDPQAPGTLVLSNTGNAKWQWPVTVLIREPGGGEPRRLELVPPSEIRLDHAEAEVLVDPFLQWADTNRENNRYPRRSEPLFVAPSERGTLVVTGEPFAWSKPRARLRVSGGEVREWEFERGILQAPRLDPEHGWFVTTLAGPTREQGTVVVLEADGSRRRVGAGTAAVPADGGAIVAAVGKKVVRYGPSGRAHVLLRVADSSIEAILPLPNLNHLGVVASDAGQSSLLMWNENQKSLETVLRVDGSLPFVDWSATNDSFVVGFPDGLTWDIWEVPREATPARAVVQGAIMLSDMALSPDGSSLALAAAPTRQYPRTRRQVYVLDLTERTVKTWSDPELDFFEVAWIDDSSLLAVARHDPPNAPLLYPWSRKVVRIHLDRDDLELLQPGSDL
ncbi:hypothetical protein HRbin30_00406 [bacterium HR30]|nr:hypothetical protein HRbin30_00406 [bacterium HR30]